MHRPLPFLALILGVAGLIPFIGCAYLALTPGGAPGIMALLAYGAVILAFLGGVHWGFALPEPSGRGERERLGLGVLPSLVGWVGLLLGIAGIPEGGIAILLAGFLGITVVEARATRLGLMPTGYMTLRYGLSATVLLVLAVVLVLRLFSVQFARI
jgi:hypothetical protein